MTKSAEVLKGLYDKHRIINTDRTKIYSIIKDIFLHDEFQRRFEDGFYHHGTTMLGEHILEDTIVTYKLCKESKKPVDTDIALKIAMMHDLYTRPWQNTGVHKKFFHRHGFAHPIEAVINSSIWFPEEFNNSKTPILADGIVHHMWPLPVMCYQDYDDNKLELWNYELSKEMSEPVKNLLISSSNRLKIGSVSLVRSKYQEGRIMSHADKKVSLFQIEDKDSAIALVTGDNKSLTKKIM